MAGMGVVALSSLILAHGTQAALYFWTGDDNGIWSTLAGAGGTNWSSTGDSNQGTAGVPGAADDVLFNLFGAANLTTELGANFSINSLTFTPDATNPVSINDTPGTHALTIGAGGLMVNGPSVYTLNAPVVLGVNQVWTNNNATNALVVNGVVSGTNTNLTLAGPGSFNFAGANTYSGSTSLSALGTLTLTGTNGSLATTSVALDGGTTLKFDNTTFANGSRLGDTVGVSAKGATIALLGTGTNETIGTVTATTGLNRINVDAGSVLTLGSATLAGLARGTGGTVNFSSTGTTKIPNQVITNGIIAGWATIGNIGAVQQDAIDIGNVLDFATLDANKNVVPFAAYDLNDFGAATKNAKVDGPFALAAASTTTINSLYLTGGARVTLGTVNTTNTILIIGSGGIIANGANQTLGGSGPQVDLVNSAVLGSGVINANNTNGGQITGTVTSASGDLVVTTASNLRIDAVIANNGATVVNLTKNGSGTLDLSDGNGNTATSTYSGITTLNGGLMTIRNDRNLGAVPTVNTANALTFNGGELRMTATITLDSHRGITVGPQGGTLSYNGGNTTQFNSFQVTGTGALTFSDIPSFNLPSGTNQCAMRLNFPAGANNYQGATTFFTQGSANGAAINAVIFFSADNQIPDNSTVVVQNDDGKGVLNLFGHSDVWGSLAGNGTIVNGSTVTPSALTVGQNNSSTTYTGNLGRGGVTFSVGAAGTVGGDNVAGPLGTSTAISLTKVGSGTLTMSGINEYTGATAINGGALLVGSGTAQTSFPSLGNTAVTVGNGTLVGALGGNGTLNGPVVVTASGHLAPAMSATTFNTLTINNNLTINGGATLDFSLGAPGSGDQVMVVGTGNLSLLTGSDVLNVTQLAGFGIGTYPLLVVAGSGALTDNAAFTVNGKTSFNYSVLKPGDAINAAAGGGTVPVGQIYLQVLQGSGNLTWKGTASGVWDVNGAANWSGDNTVFTTGANVTFDDAGATRPGVNVAAGGVSPSSIVFNSGTVSYVLAGGPVTVTAGAGVSKSQANTVTVNNNVTTPTTTITAGSFVIGNTSVYNSTAKVDLNGGALTVAGTLNTPLLNVKGGTTLTVNANAALGPATSLNVAATGNASFSNTAQTLGALTGGGNVALNGTALTLNGTNVYGGVLSGTGNLTIASGITTFSNGANSYGTTTIGNGGTLLVTNTTGSGTGTGNVLVQSGGGVGGTGFITWPVTINTGGSVTPGGAGAIGTITLGSLSIGTGSFFQYDIGALGNGDMSNTTGATTLSGTQTLNLNALPGFSAGTYTLLTAAGGLTDTATFTVNASGAASNSAFTFNIVQQGNQLLLNVAALADFKWTGAVDGTWDTTTANWAPSPYGSGARVRFDDTGAHPAITIPVDVAPSSIEFSNSAALPYSISGPGAIVGATGITVDGGGTVTLNGSNTYSGPTVITNGTLNVAADNNFGGPTGALTLNGGRLAATASFTFGLNRTVTVGSNTGTIDVAQGAVVTINNVISNVAGQAGILAKQGPGELDLGGGNGFTGGMTVNAGIVRLNNAGAAGTGPTTVNTNGTLALGSDVAAATAVTVAGGTVGPTGAGRTMNGPLTAATGTTSTLLDYDPISGAGRNDLIITGILHGSGNLNVLSAVGDTGPEGGGVRLRGAISPDYTGTITVGGSTKFEFQTAVSSGSPGGTGKLIFTAGDVFGTGNTGTFTLFNVRNNSTGDANLGNDLAITGTGFVLLNSLGSAPANSTFNFGKLTIGDGQTIAAVAAGGGVTRTFAFSSVSLTGGNATFAPRIFGNTNYTTDENLAVGPISEVTPGAGVIVNGVNTLTMNGANTYTGGTTVENGALHFGAAVTLPSTTALTVDGGTVDFKNGTNAGQTVGSLAGAGGEITSSDPSNPRMLTVNQSTTTEYAGTISGSLGLTKAGTGTLQLTGAGSFSGLALVTAGTLGVGNDTVHGVLTGVAVTVSGGATLAGYGEVGTVTALTGSRVAPGNTFGILTTSNVSLTSGVTFATTLGKTVPGSPPVPSTDYDQLSASDSTLGVNKTVALGSATLALTLGTGLEAGDIFTIILNNSSDAVGGQFAGLANNSTFTASNGMQFRISYFDDSATSTFETTGIGNDVSLQLVAVPEPQSAMLLVGAASLALGWRRGRRRA